jgi:hypothetical protein
MPGAISLFIVAKLVDVDIGQWRRTGFGIAVFLRREALAMVFLKPVKDSVSLWEEHEYWELRVQKTVLSKLY